MTPVRPPEELHRLPPSYVLQYAESLSRDTVALRQERADLEVQCVGLKRQVDNMLRDLVTAQTLHATANAQRDAAQRHAQSLLDQLNALRKRKRRKKAKR